MFCENCGEQMAENALTCPKCGAAARPARPAVEQPAYRPPVQQQNTPTVPIPPVQQYSQPVYAQPYFQAPVMPPVNTANEHVSVGGWVGIFCINLIPVLGWLIYLILLFVWAFGDTKKKTLKNFAKATLIGMLIMIILGIAVVVIAAIAGVSLTDYFNTMGNDISNQLFIH